VCEFLLNLLVPYVILGTVNFVLKADVQAVHYFRKRRYLRKSAFYYAYFQTVNSFIQTEITVFSILYFGLSYIQKVKQ
jgi:hypothetical protein